jgi:preprotein translocase subunit SecG
MVPHLLVHALSVLIFVICVAIVVAVFQETKRTADAGKRFHREDHHVCAAAATSTTTTATFSRFYQHANIAIETIDN